MPRQLNLRCSAAVTQLYCMYHRQAIAKETYALVTFKNWDFPNAGVMCKDDGYQHKIN